MPTPLLVSNLTNIRYVTGLRMTAGILLMHGKRKLLFVDDRYLEKAKKEVRRGISVLHIQRLTQRVSRFRRVRFEASDLTVARLKRWRKRFRGTKLVPSEGVIEQMRRKKKSSELKAIGKACRITDKVLAAIPKRLKRGITEKQLAWEIEKQSRELGADEMAFDTIVAFGPHSSRPHHRPTKMKLKKGDLVQIDMGVKADGYCSDCSRVFFTGNPTEKQKKTFNLLVATVKECTKSARVGIMNRSLDKYARDRLKKAGFGKEFLHGLGHGIGLEIHEGVSLSQHGKRTKLLPNEVITIEPGIYLEGKWGMRVEDTVVVGRSGGRRMTNVKY